MPDTTKPRIIPLSRNAEALSKVADVWDPGKNGFEEFVAELESSAPET